MRKLNRCKGFVCKGFVAAVVVSGAAGLSSHPMWFRGLAARAAPAVEAIPVPQLPPATFGNPQDAIVARKDTMKADGKIFKAMKAAVDSGADVAPFAADAQWFADWGRQIPQMFPNGSETGHDTKAKPDIWTDKAGFDKFANAMVAAAERLSAAAKQGDKAAFASAFQAVGKSCGGCHKAYAYPLH